MSSKEKTERYLRMVKQYNAIRFSRDPSVMPIHKLHAKLMVDKITTKLNNRLGVAQ